MKVAFAGANLPESELRILFNQLDSNKDGEINFDEFITGVKSKNIS